jgi:hypothetical protein
MELFSFTDSQKATSIGTGTDCEGGTLARLGARGVMDVDMGNDCMAWHGIKAVLVLDFLGDTPAYTTAFCF